jgi:hypothetical protein
VSRSKLFVLGIVVAGVCVANTQAWAQTAPPAKKVVDESPVEPATNVSFGYAYLYDSSWKEHLFYGWAATISHRIGRNVSLVGDVGGSHGQFRTTGFTIQRYAFLGGIKLSGGEGQVRPFFQVLAGLSRQGGDVGIANGIALQPGGGVDLTINDRLTLRGQGDFRWIREEGTNWKQYRVTGGVDFFLGKKTTGSK